MIDNLLHTLLSELQKISKAQTVIGDPIQSGDVTIVPISKVQIGFGVGQTAPGQTQQADGKPPRQGISTSGSGGGIRVEPVACIVVNKEGHAQLLHLAGATQTTISKAIDLVPEVLDRLGFVREDKHGTKPNHKPVGKPSSQDD